MLPNKKYSFTLCIVSRFMFTKNLLLSLSALPLIVMLNPNLILMQELMHRLIYVKISYKIGGLRSYLVGLAFALELILIFTDTLLGLLNYAVLSAVL